MSQRPLLVVLAVGFAIRCLCLWPASHAELLFDEATYMLRAQDLLDGRGFVGSFQSWVRHPELLPAQMPQYPGALQPPGYTAFVASVLALSGRSLTAVRFAQVLLSTLTIALVYQLALAWFDRRSAIGAAWLAALQPELIAFSHLFWSETLYVFLLVAGVLLLSRASTPPGRGAAALAGLALGLAALTRSALVLFLPVLVAWLAFVYRPSWRSALARGALALAVAFAVIAPWTLRNHAVLGGFVLIDSNGPYNLWRGNAEPAFTQRDDPSLPHYAWPFASIPMVPVGDASAYQLVADYARDVGRSDPGDNELMAYASRRAWGAIVDDPARFVARARLKLIDLWNPTSFLVRHLELGAYGPLPEAVKDALRWLAFTSYAALIALAGYGLWLAWRSPRVWLIVALTAFTSAVCVFAFGLTRFRVPLLPFFCVLGGRALAALHPRRTPATILLAALAVLACSRSDREATAPARPPNILWIVWDTVRADHLSLYGYPRETTPFLSKWARDARVFDDALSVAGYTLPSHASMFTGLLPSEHCTHNQHPWLDDSFTTVAELLHGAGYRTFLFSANPHVASTPGANLAQGFERDEHPWTPKWAPEARRLIEEKIPPEDRSSELPKRLAVTRERGHLGPWTVKAAGALAKTATLQWLASSDSARPYFVFINYMEAHRPTIPPRRLRERLLPAPDVERSYRLDRSWLPMWEYTFGLRDYSDDELALIGGVYDAALLEVDELLSDLIGSLDDAGLLENTVVILTADHGEHLGEAHMLDHQYSVHQVLLRVPLVIRYPARFAPGRDSRPVSNFDLFPTVLELAGVAPPQGPRSHVVSLLAPQTDRQRFAEEPASSDIGIEPVKERHPEFDPSPFQRRLRALVSASRKFVWGSDGRNALYDLAADPLEKRNLLADDAALAARLEGELDTAWKSFATCDVAALRRTEPAPTVSEEQREILESLGYLDSDDEAPR
jgi:arylsulfatase A-like enzyme/4-amino-4-deoxy-L-arabinose transferase-like glycosyltransferase